MGARAAGKVASRRPSSSTTAAGHSSIDADCGQAPGASKATIDGYAARSSGPGPAAAATARGAEQSGPPGSSYAAAILTSSATAAAK